MSAHVVEVYGAVARPMEVGSCAPCNLFWFDEAASVRLVPRAVLELFQVIGQAGAATTPLAGSFRCPRCRDALVLTHDLQRATRFTFWRCPDDRGQLMTFGQFLAEKNFIRPPTADELARLRATVRQVSCSQCGAPIDLVNDAACPHCGAAVALIDTEGVARALHELASLGEPSTMSPAAATSAALRDAQIDSLFDLARIQNQHGSHDLLAIGATAIVAAVGDWLLSR